MADSGRLSCYRGGMRCLFPVLLALVAPVAVAAEKEAPPTLATSKYLVRGAAAVVDGDTLVVQRQRVRLWGIDAPELDQECGGPGARVACGKRARAKLAWFVEGQVVWCVASLLDGYGRLVARCFNPAGDLGEMMVRSGWALTYRRYSGKAYAPAECAAWRGRDGVWAAGLAAPWDWRQGRRSRTYRPDCARSR